jgi:lysophospholipase L1-like esterase
LNTDNQHKDEVFLERAMMIKILKCILLFFIFLWILLSAFILWSGGSSIILTLTFYALVWLIVTAILKYFSPDKEKFKNYMLFTTILILGLFTIELYLKYIDKSHDYPFDSPALETLGYKYIRKQKDLRLQTNDPFTDEIVTSSRSNEYHYRHVRNSLGLRGKEPLTDTSKFNIAVIGDSFTEGFGAPEDSTWVCLLENKLNQEKVFEQKIQCINGGTCNLDPFSEYVVLEDLLLKFNPKIVILCTSSEDIADVVHAGGWERYNAHGERVLKPRPWWFPVYQCSFIARHLIHSLGHLNYELLTDQEFDRESQIAINKIEKCVTVNYANLAKTHNFKLVVVVNPMLSELETSDFKFKQLTEHLEANENLKVINLFEAFVNEKKINGFDYKSLYWPIDGHNNSKGYNLWAGIVKDSLLNDLYADESLNPIAGKP